MRALSTTLKILYTITVFSLLPFIVNAASFSQIYLYPSTISANQENVEYIIAIKPSATTTTTGTLTITFTEEESQKYCKAAGTDLTVTAITSTPVGTTTALPGTLTGLCTSTTNTTDTIVIEGITTLTSNTLYGVKISNGTTAKLGTPSAGPQKITITLSAGTRTDSNTFKTYFVGTNGTTIGDSDTVTIKATVDPVPTISCNINTPTVNIGTIPKGGNYVTATGTISASTNARYGYYWAIYGKGNGTTAGLYKSTTPTHLISSYNDTGTINLATTTGFGIQASNQSATIGSNFSAGSTIFGSLGVGSSQAKILVSKGSTASEEITTLTLGAKASTSAEAGSYTETLTFICGGYY